MHKKFIISNIGILFRLYKTKTMTIILNWIFSDWQLPFMRHCGIAKTEDGD